MRRRGLGVAIVLCACGAAPRVRPVAPAAPAPVPRDSTAVAILEVAEPTAEELGGTAATAGLPEPVAHSLAMPARSRDEALDTWALLLQSQWVRRRAGAALGIEPPVGDVGATRDGLRITLQVRADGRDGAVARCKAMVRAANEETGRGHTAAREWLDEERSHLADELAAIEESLDDVPPDRGIDLAEPVAAARAEASSWRAALPALTIDAPLPDATAGAAAPSLLVGLRAQAAELARQRAELATRYLDRHPLLRALDVRRTGLAERFEAQRDRERAYFDALGRELEASPQSGAARARLAALLATLLEAPVAASDFVVPSAAAPALRALAQGAFAERQALAVLAERTGERHPERVAQQVRLDALRQELRDEVAREIAALRETIAAVDRARGRSRTEVLARQAERADGRLGRAAGLRAMVRVLERRTREQEQEPWARYRIIDDCHATNEGEP